MNFEINEMEFFPIARINQISSYDTKITDGIVDNEVYKTNIYIKLQYIDNELNSHDKEINLPFELNLGDKELLKIEILNIDVQVIDNQGLNIEYNLNVEISDVEFAYDQNYDENSDVEPEKIKENITTSYEEKMELTGIREEIPVKYVENEDSLISSLKDDFMNVKVLFNVNVDEIDKVAFKYELSIDSCYKKLSKDKTRLII